MGKARNLIDLIIDDDFLGKKRFQEIISELILSSPLPHDQIDENLGVKKISDTTNQFIEDQNINIFKPMNQA